MATWDKEGSMIDRSTAKEEGTTSNHKQHESEHSFYDALLAAEVNSTHFTPPLILPKAPIFASKLPYRVAATLPYRPPRRDNDAPTLPLVAAMRRIVYGISFWVFVAAAACTLASVILPNWISYTAPTDVDPIRVRYGLHQRCSSITGQCAPFPQYEDCVGEDRSFCSMWRSTGFLMNFSLVVELACVVAYITILVGGRANREGGWKPLAGLLGLVAAAQLIAMALVAYLYDHDNRFFQGWELDKSWILCTVSWAVLAVNSIAMLSAQAVLPSEDDYEAIPEPRD